MAKLPKNFKTIAPPYIFQTDTIDYGIRRYNAGLLLDLGLGKTYCAINIARYLIQNKGIKKILTVLPAGVMLNWQNEIEKFSEYKAIVLHDSVRKKRLQLIDTFANYKIPFGIINYEALPLFFKELTSFKIDAIIIDESSRYISNKDSNRTKALIGYTYKKLKVVGISDRIPYRYLLTGTLIRNKPMGIWSQFRFLDGGATFGTNFYSWKNYFFNEVNSGGYKKWIIRKERIPYLHKKIYQSCIRFEKREVFKQLPPITYVKYEIKMPPKLNSEYKIVREQVLSEIENEFGSKAYLNITNILTKFIRLQQITSGFIKDENNNLHVLKQTPKLDMLIDQLAEITDQGESAIIWCKFRPSIALIAKHLTKLKYNHVVMTGSDNPKEKYRKWKGFQESKTINIFLGQITAGGIGIELFKKDTVDKFQHTLFYEYTWVLDDRIQAIGRNDGRIGQTSACRVVDLVIKGSIDEKMLGIVLDNKKIADLITTGDIRNVI